MKRTTATLTASALLCLTLGACTSTQTTDGVKKNKTTIAQAEKMYGEPTKTRYGADGSETWTWEDQKVSVKFMDGVAVDSWTN